MRHVLVIRFGALGDLCLLAATLARAADAPGARRVTLVTKPAFAALLGETAGVDEVVTLPPGGAAGLLRLARSLARRRWDAVVDAHGVLRSRALTVLMGRRPAAVLAKDTFARLGMLAGRPAGIALRRTMRDRFDALLPAVTGGAPAPAAAPAVFPALAGHGGRGALLGVAPGARWATKRWPERHFATLLRDAADAGIAARVFLGPDESGWFDAGPLAAAVAATDAELVRDEPLPRVAQALAGCGVVVTNDSGLLHLAEAVGTPVVALFGPTVRAFGYYPNHAASRVLETEIDCRPCSRNGRRPCHRGDLACLTRVAPAEVLAAARALLTGVEGNQP